MNVYDFSVRDKCFHVYGLYFELNESNMLSLLCGYLCAMQAEVKFVKSNECVRAHEPYNAAMFRNRTTGSPVNKSGEDDPDDLISGQESSPWRRRRFYKTRRRQFNLVYVDGVKDGCSVECSGGLVWC